MCFLIVSATTYMTVITINSVWLTTTIVPTFVVCTRHMKANKRGTRKRNKEKQIRCLMCCRQKSLWHNTSLKSCSDTYFEAFNIDIYYIIEWRGYRSNEYCKATCIMGMWYIFLLATLRFRERALQCIEFIHGMQLREMWNTTAYLRQISSSSIS